MIDLTPTNIEDLRALRRSRYYKRPDPDLTDLTTEQIDRLKELRRKRDLKVNNDIKSHKRHKDERDRIMSGD